MSATLAATLLGSTLTCVGAGYALAAALVSRRPALSPDPSPASGRGEQTDCSLPSPTPVGEGPGERAISILKPLCGDEPRLYDNLATLCTQQGVEAQLVCGVRDHADPAIAVVERLQRDLPAFDIALVVDPHVHGSNLKVSNLINLSRAAKHDLLVVADSDIAAPPDYLARVCAPLADPAVGIVTCLYRGRAIGGLWARLGAQFIDDWFAPSVRIAHALGSRKFAFGATIALRRDTLDAIGGFAALADKLADDYWLGELTRQRGLRTVLSDVVVTTDVTESRLATLWSHELRWLRTIRSLNPTGFAFTFVTFTWPMLVAGLLLAPSPAMLAVAVAGVIARSILAGNLRGALRAPLRDLLLLAGWAAALPGTHVRWREQVLPVRSPRQAPRQIQTQHPRTP